MSSKTTSFQGYDHNYWLSWAQNNCLTGEVVVAAEGAARRWCESNTARPTADDPVNQGNPIAFYPDDPRYYILLSKVHVDMVALRWTQLMETDTLNWHFAQAVPLSNASLIFSDEEIEAIWKGYGTDAEGKKKYISAKIVSILGDKGSAETYYISLMRSAGASNISEADVEGRLALSVVGASGQVDDEVRFPGSIGAIGEVDLLWFKDISPEFQVWQDTFPFTMEAPQPDITSVWTGQHQEWTLQDLEEFNLEELYSPDTTIDTSWFQYRAMPLPDSMLSPYLQGQRIPYLEAAQAHQEYETRKQGRIEELQRQIQWAKRISPAPDESYFYDHGTRLSPEEEELSRLLYGEQQALENIQRIMSGGGVQQGPPVEAWQAAPGGVGLLERLNRPTPGEKVLYLIEFKGLTTPGVTRQYQQRQILGFGSGSGTTTHEETDYLLTHPKEALDFLKYKVELKSLLPGEARPLWYNDALYYLKQEGWNGPTGHLPEPSGPLYNYIPPENEAFNVASVSSLGLPLTGYGAGFLGMPSGGGGTTASSSLSLPSFPSASLPSLGGGPSALPSPVGLGGVGGVPSTPSVGLSSLGWDGVAMPIPSIGLSRSGGVSAPAMPAMGAASPMGMPGGPAIPSSAPSAPVSAQGGPSGGGGLDFASLRGGSRQSMIPGSQSFAGTETAEVGQSLSRAEKLVDRLMQIPDMLAMAESQSLGSLGSSGKSAGDVSQRTQPQQLVRMVINRHETVSKKKLEQYVTAWLESQSRVG
ncbi:MAG: hypothetical protein E3J71_02325 [Candidatus Stahlbacteria bacterium]|nr:MAG: hypothetical protein E3J71_02325 [Candidatus Stahlbacteria bacterium]